MHCWLYQACADDDHFDCVESAEEPGMWILDARKGLYYAKQTPG